jgi:hypothetical protein
MSGEQASVPSTGMATTNPNDIEPRLIKGKVKKKMKATKKNIKKGYDQ